MRLSNTDARMVRAVLLHNGIPTAEHDAIIDAQIFTCWHDGRRRSDKIALRTYRRIYGTLTEAERCAVS